MIPAAQRGGALAALLLLFFLAALCYGLWLPQQGVYWDSWPLLWVAHSQGFDGLRAYTAPDRPAQVMPYWWLYLLAGPSPLGWHVVGLVLRLASSLGALFLARSLWPAARFETAMMAALCLVSPAFLQQPNAVIYAVHFLALTLAALSLAATVRAATAASRARQAGWTLSAALLALGYLSLLDSFAGLEVFRFFLIMHLAGPGAGLVRRLRHVLRSGWLYILTGAGFLFWRVCLFESTRADTDVGAVLRPHTEHLLQAGLSVAAEALRGMLEVLVFAWFTPADARLAPVSALAFCVYLALGVVAGAAVVWFQRRTGTGTPGPIPGAGALGLAGVLFALMPALVAGRNVVLLHAADRYALPCLIVAPLAVLAAVQALGHRSRVALLASLVCLSVVAQAANQRLYARDWQAQRALWWQLWWRAPALRPGTVIVLQRPSDDGIPREDLDVWAPANFIYAAGGQMTIGGQLLREDLLAPLQQRARATIGSRSTQREFSLGQALIVTAPGPDSCLRALDADQPLLPSGASSLLAEAAAHSSISAIGPVDPSLRGPALVLGPEPAHSWCYFFEMAERARQDHDVGLLAHLASEVERLDLAPRDSVEWLPFVAGFQELERWSEAQRLVTRLRGEGALAADARTAVCGWRSGLTRTTESAALLDAVDAAFECRAGGGSGAEVRE